MFNTTHINNIMILTPDVIRMTPAREQAIREYAINHGNVVAASIDTNVDGSLKSIDLFGGNSDQRVAFREGLTAAILY